MRKYLFAFIISAALILGGFLLYTTMLTVPKRPTVNNIEVNEIVKQSALSWQNLSQMKEMGFTYRFFIVDNDNNVCYTSTDNLPDDPQTAIQLGYLSMDITINSNIVGRVFIETFPDSYMDQAQRKLSNATYLSFLLLSILVVTTMVVLYMTIIRPFNRLEGFAHKISTGKFDEPLPIDRNNMFGLFTQSFDVMRTSLLEARQQQNLSERAKKELIASLNHDIKTPITSIRLTSELLQAINTDPLTLEKLKTIDDKANQIDRLMNDMLHSALEELEELKVNITSESSTVLSDLFISENHLSKIKIGEIPPCLIQLDTVRMQQVIGNIVANSYKYANTDIDVFFRICDEVLQIDINDYGKGVAPDELELICTKFYRGENAKASHKDGEGLGLYISKILMEKMGGGLETFNRKDGFSVRIWLHLSH